jgi:hypothetical protein
MTNCNPTTTLFRPVGPNELELIKESGFREFPPRLPDQPIFYPVLNEEYARQIAVEWNVPASGSGYVTRFKVASTFLNRYPNKKLARPFIESFGFPLKSFRR